MNRITELLINVLKEIGVIVFTIVVLLSFLLPTLSIWCGLFKESFEIEVSAITLRTNIVLSRLESTGDFFWDLNEYVPYDSNATEEE